MTELMLPNGTNEQAKSGFCSVVFVFGRAWVRNERTNTPLRGGVFVRRYTATTIRREVVCSCRKCIN